MKKQIVWVMGVSAAGKETFIKKVLHDISLRELFGWQNQSVTYSPTSVKIIGQSDNDPIVEQRERILPETCSLLKTNDIVLIKHQFVDSQANRVARLAEVIPEVQHRIVLLEISESEAERRLINKSWWNPSDDPTAWFREDMAIMQKEIEAYEATHEITKWSGER